MHLVDSCGWLEYFADGPLAQDYYHYLKKPKETLTPTIVVYEVYKKIKRDRGEEPALLAVAQLEESEIVSLTQSISLLAADLSLEHQIPMADAIVYATAKTRQAKLITSDNHFEKLDNVVYLKKN